MKHNGIESRFRNLLISLARDAEKLKAQVTQMHLDVDEERHGNRRAAIYTLIRERNKQRARLLRLLSRNSAASRHFFGTVNPQAIACEQILFASNHE